MNAPIERHWLWIAFGQDSDVLYGCLVHAVDHWVTLAEHDKSTIFQCGEKQFCVVQALIEADEAAHIADEIAAQSAIDLSSWGGPKIKLTGLRHRLIDGFSRCAQPALTHACENVPDLSDEAWQTALDFLKRTLGVDFRQAADRLGTFDVFEQSDLAGISGMVRLDVDRDETNDTVNYPDRITLHNAIKTEARVALHLELQLGGERVFSKLFQLDSGQKLAVQAVCFDQYRMSVFNSDGLMMQCEEYPLLLRVGLNMSMLESTRVIDDRLSRSAQGLTSELRGQASRVQTRSTSRSLIGVKNVAFDVHQTRMRALIKRLAPPVGSDRWFPRGVAHEISVIAFFNSLLNGARVSAGTIVDPWFGIDTLKRVIARIESLDVSITVVTSLGSKDPETNEMNPNLLTQLQDSLDELRHDRVPNAAHRLRLVNLIDGTEQAFHDRYLLLTPHEGEREVYLLSNSLNRMAGKWPFCISKLDPAAAHDAARYIDGLASGRDISGSTQPTVSFQWSSNEGR